MRPVDADKIEYYSDETGNEIAYKVDIDQLPTITPSGWVSVEERLPEHMKDVIVLYGGGEIDIDWVDSLGDFRFDNLFGRVTHWMPLPAPPDRRPPEGEA